MAFSLFQSQAAPAVINSVLNAKWRADLERQREASNRLDLYSDDYEVLIKEALAKQFHKDTFAKLQYHVNQSQNILKRVINEISMVYKAEARRSLDVENDRYEFIKQNLDLDSRMKRINKLTNLLNETLVKVGIRDGEIVYDTITPNICLVIQNWDDPTIPDAIIFQRPLLNNSPTEIRQIEYEAWDIMGNRRILNSEFRTTQEIYTPNNYPYHDDRGRVILPFVVSHRQMPEDTFWDQDSGRDLYNASLLTGCKMTLFDYYLKVASFKQPYIIGENMNIPDNQVLDVLKILTATTMSGGTAQIGTLDLQIAFDKFVTAMVFQINTVINNYGISADQWTMSVGEMSGRALRIKNRALLELRQEQLPLYRKFETDLFNITRIVNNAHSGTKGVYWNEDIPEAAKFSIDFGEIDFPDDPKDEIALWGQKLRSGLISLGQFYQHFNPDIKDEAEAEKAIINNLNQQKTLREENPTLDEALNFILAGPAAKVQTPPQTPEIGGGQNV